MYFLDTIGAEEPGEGTRGKELPREIFLKKIGGDTFWNKYTTFTERWRERSLLGNIHM